jgi:hypothetical protein
MRAHFEMCYMVTKFPKRMLRATGRSIRIKRLIQEFSSVEKPCEEEKVPYKN